MSRNHKEKYENTTNRRSHTIMSSEDAAAGKRSDWPELEITGDHLISWAALKRYKLIIIEIKGWSWSLYKIKALFISRIITANIKIKYQYFPVPAKIGTVSCLTIHTDPQFQVTHWHTIAFSNLYRLF